MDTQTQEPVEMGTKPIKEHAWLQKLVGEWRIESEMWMGPDQPKVRLEGTEIVKSVGGLWAYAERTGKGPNGISFNTYATLGYDVSFKEYRGCWFGSMSSHLWKQVYVERGRRGYDTGLRWAEHGCRWRNGQLSRDHRNHR